MEKTFFSQDAEISILSTLLKDSEKLFMIPDVQDFMFSSEANKKLYKSLEELVKAGYSVDANLLTNALQSRGEFEAIGGDEYIRFLLSKDINSENIKEYERILISNYKARALHSLASSITNTLTSSDAVEQTLSSFRNSLDRLMITAGGESVQDMGTALKQSWEVIVDRLNNPGIRGYPFGIKAIDSVVGGVGQGDYWVIAARPSIGKTAVMCNAVLSAASQGVPCLVFSLEMNRQALSERLIAIESGISISDIRLGNLNQKQVDKMAESVAKIKSYPIFMDTKFTPSLSYVETSIRKQVKNNGVKLVYIDYLQLLSERGEDDTKELGRISRKMKILANDLNIGTILLSQLNRDVEKRDDRRPILSDLRQSGNIEEDADLVILLYRDDYYHKDSKQKGLMEFIIRKNRNGPTGTIPLLFESDTNIVKNM